MPGRVSALALTAVLAALAAGCGGGGNSSATSAVVGTQTGGSGERVTLQKVGDFDQPDYVTQPPGGQDLYVVEQGGTVRIVRGGEVLSKPAIDISGEVTASGEQGLLSIAFPPDFQRSRVVYAYFTGTDQDQHVVRYSVRPDGTFDEASAREILHMADFAPNHNGGSLVFGPDGDLYIGTGDGGLEGDPHRNGQNLGSLLGKLLRIKPSTAGGPPYAIPADNPFRIARVPGPRSTHTGCAIPGASASTPRPGLWSSETSARTPSRRSTTCRREGDAGRTSDGRPSRAPTGSTPIRPHPNAVPPIFEYSHDHGCSITGGYIVRDRTLGALYGRYIYADFCAGDLPQPRAGDPSCPR